MADLHKYIMIACGLSILLTILGFDTMMGSMFTAVYGDTSQFYDLFYKTIKVMATATAAAIVIGYLTKSTSEWIVMIPYISLIMMFAYDWLILFTYSLANYPGWVSGIVGLMMIPFAFGFAHALIGWWMGRT